MSASAIGEVRRRGPGVTFGKADDVRALARVLCGWLA
jgi:hypothetical protein